MSATVQRVWKALSSDGECFLSLRRDYERYKSGRPGRILPSRSRDRCDGSTSDGTGVRRTHSQEITRQGEEVADYLIDAGKELMDKCEDLYERSGEMVEDATHELSGKYRTLRENSRQLLDEAESILRRTKSGAVGR
jgi:hypothetical protein